VRLGAVTPYDETDESVRTAAAEVAIRARATGQFQIEGARVAMAQYIAAVPISGDRVVTVAAFARRNLAPPSPLGSLLALSGRNADEPLTLVPLLLTDRPLPLDTTRWVRGEEGWQAERVIEYREGSYNALYALRLPGPLLRLARGALLLALDIGLFLLLWGAGRFVALGRQGLPGVRPGFATSFRARVSAALFGFFLISIVIFATLAFRTLTRAGERTAIALAENVVENVARSYSQVEGSMLTLARNLGSHLLEYREGMLHEGSKEAEELIELGLYEGWLPPEVYLPLSNQASLLASSVGSIGTTEYVVAYRRLPDGDVVATPVSLEAGAVALRRREVGDMLLFAVLLGGALSLGLAILVGRAFARPIQTLQVASERVGSGNMDVRLAEQREDEFGSVFLAFNRMVESLDRARRDLVRTSRRTRAIVEEAATGVVAVDSHANVTLVNPRAELMLGCTLDVDDRIAPVTPASREFARWVDQYFRQAILEATTEIQSGPRRIRVRGRRIAGWGSGEGAVFSLEDVTDELRSERILAWGEMARQVAHEVKNPLTPIRLSVQHVNRAWEDRRPEFGSILTRNVEAILREIDRLAAIASSFSRFGAPGEAGETPLEAVELRPLIEETLALYAGGDGPISFVVRIEGEVPPVRTRPGELKEVLVNLLENARVAVGDPGIIEVHAAWSGGDDRVLLEVSDDGDGIAESVLPRIFEPHFSTRSAGTGLGLAIVRRLVESWGGSVEAESRRGQGTRIRMFLVPGGLEEGSGGALADESRVLGPLFEPPDGPEPASPG
jgi:PAS domain S-box-containing protein